MSDGKCCLYCGKPLTRRGNETPGKFNNRRFCNVKCSSAHTAKSHKRQPPGKLHNCLHCQGRITPHPKEGPAQYAKRKFCSSACASRFYRGGTREAALAYANPDWPAGATFTDAPQAMRDTGSPGRRILGRIQYGPALSETGSQLGIFG